MTPTTHVSPADDTKVAAIVGVNRNVEARPSTNSTAALRTGCSHRADFLTFGTLGHLQSTNNWYRIGQEWFFDRPACTESGREIAR
ncbi:hypothetical protein ACFXPR_06980 [Nocardia tengchongensis]|uniref:hypothetical protein n=1 Tax=Nocardia tengchongensis TaxID=2055889 RepID=UPI0036A1194D